MKTKDNLISLISVISILLVGMALTGCVSMPPLHDAAFKGDVRTAKELLDKGANIDESQPLFTDLTPLMYAAMKGHIEVVKLLVERGANINVVYNPGGVSRTPLAFAAIAGHKEIVKYLVDKGADIDRTIFALRKATNSFAKVDNQIALEFLQGFKKEMADSTQQKRVQPAALDKASPTIKSDVDELPSIKAKPNKNSYAIVIGIEQYRQKLPKADFATSDARLVTEYLIKALGYPEENIITLTNEQATKSDFEKYIEEWLPKNIESNSSVFVYYSGHGAPNTKTGDAFLVPYDGDPNFIEKTGYPLKKLYDTLSKLQAKEVIVALDSCFSGAGGHSVLAQGSRPLVMNLQTTLSPAKNMIIMAASSGSETSSTYNDKGHGLFTYFMLKGIKGEADMNEDGKIEIEELYQYLKPNVQKIARRLYNNEQTPQLIAPEKQKIFLRD